MKQHLSLTELATELESRATAKQDFVASTNQLQMGLVDGNIMLKTATSVDGLNQARAINEIAHRQIASRLSIPANYYDRLRSEAPQLLAENVNHWFHAKPENRMIRTLNGNVRAFLSDRYQRIENEQIANTVLPILLEQEGVRIESCAITEQRMHIKAVFSKVEGEVSSGDIIQAGVAISNSEVGQGSVKIEPLIFRLICLNGMIMNDSKYSARHIGARIAKEENIIEMLSDEALRADDTAILLKVRDVVRASFDSVRFEQHLQLMRGATQERIEGNPSESVKVLSKKLQLTEFEEGSILRHLIEGGDTSRWGIANAVTRTAQDVESYDRATELEGMGSNILLFPKQEWQQIAIAA